MSSKRIPISEAKSIAQKYGYDQVIILASSETTNWYTSYGRTRALCKLASQGIKNIYDWLKSTRPETTVYLQYVPFEEIEYNGRS